MNERCVICDCILHRIAGTYARPSAEGRSHATKHHFVAERFFGRSSNRRGTVTDGVFSSCQWGHEGETAVFCYECHEDLLRSVEHTFELQSLMRISYTVIFLENKTQAPYQDT